MLSRVTPASFNCSSFRPTQRLIHNVQRRSTLQPQPQRITDAVVPPRHGFTGLADWGEAPRRRHYLQLPTAKPILIRSSTADDPFKKKRDPTTEWIRSALLDR
jgi:hypothetical protein